jgi:alkanesulfonate monooxygenase SsuD/methylene tetrahydromethanopterin reductase-like flavin-dependent oxidoreductase (luciferase family)
MPDPSAPLKLGANLWNQHTDWPGFRDAMLRAETLGYDSLWTWDHVYPIIGSPDGPMLETWTAMAAIAALTSKPTIGHLVGANTFRNPALTAKMITTIDHISGGRAILGIGAAWFEPEHTGFGFDFGSGPPERLRWLSEALPVLRGMLDGTQPTATGPRYAAQAVRNDPPPIQAHLPILIGGGGRKVTLKLVARHADMNNLGNPVGSIADAEAALLEHCRTEGRDERTVERTVEVQRVIIRDDAAEAWRVQDEILAHNTAVQDEVRPGSGSVNRDRAAVGTADDVFAHIAPLVEAGYHHVICGFPAPYDAESMQRMAAEVRPRLEELIAS